MSLLNEVEAIPAAISALCSYLAMTSIDEDEAVALFTPVGLRQESSSDSDADRLRKVIQEAARLGLIRRDGTSISLAEGTPSPSSEGIAYRRYVRRRVLDGNDDLRIVLGWLITWSVALRGSATGGKLDDSLVRRLGNVTMNPTRWENMGRWAVWLGLAWRDGAGLVPDATAAIAEDVLPTLAEGSTVPIWDIVDLVEQVIPLPGGWRRSDTLQPEIDELAPALTLALLRLELAGRIRVRLLSDSGHSLRLPSRDGPRTVSHLLVQPRAGK